MNKDDKLPAGDIKEKSKLLSWLDNWWYHNRAKFIIILFVIVVLVISIAQMCTKDKPDVLLLYGGPYLMSGSEREGVKSVFDVVLPEDYDKDGEMNIELITYQVMSQAQLTEYESEVGVVNRGHFSREFESYSNILLAGESSIYLVDPWLYNNLLNQERLKKLSEVTGGATPQGAIDEYGVRLGDTALYEHYEALRVLPADTLICFLHPNIIGSSSKKENYERSAEMFHAIVSFEAPEEGMAG